VRAIDNFQDGLLGALTKEQADALKVTTKAVNRLTKIINDILDLSRFSSGKIKFEPAPLKVLALIEAMTKSLKMGIKDGRIALDLNLAQDLPDCYGDSEMINRLLTNLLDNALRFAKSKVVIQAKANQGLVEISVSDDGPGIQSDRIKYIFDKFVQISRPRGGSGYKGTGLGLAICKEIVEFHKGKIWAEAKEGQGAQFHFTLPVYSEQVAQERERGKRKLTER